MKAVIFTDLDGTLLNEKYSFQEVKPTIECLRALSVFIIFCSSKTSAEIEFYRNELNIGDPFISENGAAIFIPKGYFKSGCGYTRQTEKYDVIELGTAYPELRQKFESIREKTNCKIIGFGDMSVEEIARDCGLNLELAKIAKQREYDEPFRVLEGSEKELLSAIRNERLYVTKGDKYYHLTGKHNKGTAISLLKELYIRNFKKLRTIGVGNGPNDISMLEMVETPILLEKTENLSEIWKRILANAINLNF